MRTEPDKNLLYQHQKLLKPYSGVDPNPPTVNLLPLRPKSCHPRMRNGAIDLSKPEIEVNDYAIIFTRLSLTHRAQSIIVADDILIVLNYFSDKKMRLGILYELSAEFNPYSLKQNCTR